jgi:aspartyl aminopeptidase
MITVNKTANNIVEGIANMMAGAKEDYKQMSTSYGKKELTGYSKEQVDNWDNKTKVKFGKKYVKIVQDTGVFAFVIKEDSGRFKKGDILKAAGYNAPALNSARGNVLTGNYPIQWTGPLYMDTQRRLRG